jgi:hypothetical protein
MCALPPPVRIRSNSIWRLILFQSSITSLQSRNSNAKNIKDVGDLAKFVIVPIRGYQYPAEVEKFVGGVPAVFHAHPTDTQRVSRNQLTSPAYTVEVDLYRPAKRSTSFG